MVRYSTPVSAIAKRERSARMVAGAWTRSPFTEHMFSNVALYSIPLVLMSTLPKLRILIADDSALVRRGIISLLLTNAGWEICGEAADGAEALQKMVAKEVPVDDGLDQLAASIDKQLKDAGLG